MKKLILPIVLLIFTVQLMAQKVRVGFTGGGNFSKLIFKGDAQDPGDKYRVGYNVGMFTDFPLSKNFSIQPAISLIRKGMQNKDGEDKIYINLNYIEIPLNLVYKTKGATGHWFIGGGPYVANAIYSRFGGKHKNNVVFSDDVSFGTDSSKMMRGMDIGANAMVGYVFKKGLMVSGFYSRGLYDLTSVRVKGESFYNQSFGVKIGWMFHSITGD